MNKAITDGLILTPPQFADGLDVWSRGNGRPGSATYDGYANGAFVPADQDFGGCLEILKTEATQRLRYMGETPLLPGCYLRITARVKAVSGNLPTVRIAAYPGKAGGGEVGGVTKQGPATVLTSYGDIIEVSAIVGTGIRPGNDMAWGGTATFGHFGLDITGPNGGIIRIDDIEIEDVTGAFLRTMMDWVDVKDFGAIGDGVFDNSAAFAAADASAIATGREVLVSDGTYRLSSSFTFNAKVRFEGTVEMPDVERLGLRQNFYLDAYIDAFGDEVLGFKKAFQALIQLSDHESLDMNGRAIQLTAPLDMRSAIPDTSTFASRRIIRNGQFDTVSGAAWNSNSINSAASYSSSNPYQLTSVVNVANIAVGARVSGNGVGREVYVLSKNIGAQTIELSNPLWGPAGSQTYTFKRDKYQLDFSGFESISRLGLSDIHFKCDGISSGVMLSKQGLIWHFRDCDIDKPKDRGITSIGRACQGMLIDRCQFISNEQQLKAQDRSSIAFNVNANDAKIRDNRCVRFAHFGVLNGSGHIITGNHWFHGDEEQNGTRQAGLVLTKTNSRMVIEGNYIDNNFIEWNNEHDPDPDFASELSFGALSIVGNNFTSMRVGPWFRWLVIKPYGSGHFVNGLNVSGNMFKALDGDVDRVEMVDDSIATLDFSRMRNVTWTGNTYHAVGQWTISPVMLQFQQSSPASTWVCDFADYMPFGGRVRNVEAVTAEGPLKLANNVTQYLAPYAQVEQGTGGGEVRLNWSAAVKGKVNVTARTDNPF